MSSDTDRISSLPPLLGDPFEPGRDSLPTSKRLIRSIPTWLVILALIVAIVAPAGVLIHVPYYSLGPGPAVDVLSLVNVRGARTYPSRGKLLITTAAVSTGTLNLWDVVYVWLHPALTLEPRSALIQPGNTQKLQDLENVYDMEISKLEAELAAFAALGIPVHKVNGARIVTVVSGSPADGKLREGDLIVAVDGKTVSSPTDAARLLSKHRVGDTVDVRFVRGRRIVNVTMRTTRSISNPPHPAIGIIMAPVAYRLPANVEIDSERIVGPSGGFVFALAIADVLTPGDLTGGHVIAATGTIGYNPVTRRWEIGLIGAIKEKVRGAAAQHADIFLAPAAQAAQAKSVAPKSMRVIGVSTLAQTLDVLRSLPPLRR